MNVSAVAATAVTLLDFYAGYLYCAAMVRKESFPRLATWLIFELGCVMSLATYLAGQDRSLLKAALNLADILQVSGILATLLIAQRG